MPLDYGIMVSSPILGTHRPHSSSFLGLPYRILHMNPKKELLWGLWVMQDFHQPKQSESVVSGEGLRFRVYFGFGG